MPCVEVHSLGPVFLLPGREELGGVAGHNFGVDLQSVPLAAEGFGAQGVPEIMEGLVQGASGFVLGIVGPEYPENGVPPHGTGP
jgi:hypothetical protein